MENFFIRQERFGQVVGTKAQSQWSQERKGKKELKFCYKIVSIYKDSGGRQVKRNFTKIKML